MQIHLTATEKDGVKTLDGGCRIASLPASGMQRIRMIDLKGRFKPFTRLDEESGAIIFKTSEGDVSFKIEELPNPGSSTGGNFLCSVVPTKLTKRLMEAK